MIAVSIFIKQNGDKISICSLAADDVISKLIERMLREQSEYVIKYIDASHYCADAIGQITKTHEPDATEQQRDDAGGRGND
jgi:hypothetical protein